MSPVKVLFIRFVKIVALVIGWFIIMSAFITLCFRWIPVPFTPLMAIRYFEQEKTVFEHNWESIENISPYLQLAVICSEDQKFMKHKGFDIAAIEKAMEQNLAGKTLKGASTISQQTAKNIFLWPSRSWIRKGFEAYFTFLIEFLWPKERILEVYLNSIEMGNGIYGASAAAKYWFGKSPAKLTKYEAAAIAAILPNPRKYRAHPPTAFIQRRKEWIVTQMRYYGPLELHSKKEK